MDPTLKRLLYPCTAGDLPSVQAILSEWKSTQDPVEAAKPRDPKHAIQYAFEVAVRSNHLDIITYFLQQGFPITHRVVKNAIKAHSTTALELFLTYGWQINNRWRHHRLPSICVAISRNYLPLVTWFLAHGASPNVRHTRYTSVTPLTCAVLSACPTIVCLLLDHGARVDHGNLLSTLCQSKLPGRLYILGLLVERGAPVNELDHLQNPQRFRMVQNQGLGTPLHCAIEHGRVAIGAALLAHGADKGVRDTKGRTPLELARELGRGEMEALLDAE